MRNNRKSRRAFAAGGALLLAAAPALAEDSLSDSVEKFLNNAQNKIDETKIWKFRLKPSLRESVIYTDNAYLNAEDENDVQLTRVIGPGATVVTDPAQLQRIASSSPDFANTATQGRKSDFILQSELGADIILPVNDSYSKAFDKKDAMTLLGVKLRSQEYLDLNDLDNNAVFLHTDLFGFLNDLLNRDWGNNFWVRMKDEYSDLNDPLDAEIRLLQRTGLASVRKFSDFGRKENTFNFDTGYHAAKTDFTVGYEKYNLWINDRDLDQAEHGRHNFHAEVGSLVPGWEQQRAYLRYDYYLYHFARAPIQGTTGVVGEDQILNDATVQRATLGVAGPMVSDKMDARLEGAYESWDPHQDGLSADNSHYAGFNGHVRVAYQPWEDQNTRFQFEYGKTLSYSAISNYNKEHSATFQVLHEVVPKRLDADFTIGITTTSPSDGPDRKLFSTGVGLTYHVYKQLDVTFRYLFEHQTARNEIVTTSAFASGSRVYEYTVRSNGEFYQNVLELGFLLHF